MLAIVPTADLPADTTEAQPLSELLSLIHLPTPQPGPGQIRIRIETIGMNAADLLQSRGHYPAPPGVTPVLGLECAGTIDAKGPSVSDLETAGHTLTDLRIGARVCALLPGGAYADTVCINARHVMPLPYVPSSHDPMIAAAALVESCAASWMMLADVGGLKQAANRKRVLIHGASGAVGSVAVQLADTWGHQVFATAGSPQRCHLVEQLTEVTCFDYHGNWSEFVKERGGVDFIMDVIGAAGLNSNLNALARYGTLAVLGMIKGSKAELNLGQLIAKNGTVAARTVRSQSDDDKASLCRHLVEDVWPLVASGAVRPVVGRVAEIAEVGQLLTLPAADRHEPVFGKTVLRANWPNGSRVR